MILFELCEASGPKMFLDKQYEVRKILSILRQMLTYFQ